MCKTKNPGGATGHRKPLKVNAVESDGAYAFSVGLGSGSEDEASVTIRNMLIDSGATCNVIDRKTWEDKELQTSWSAQASSQGVSR